MIRIVLDHAEMWSACCTGLMRQLQGMRRGFNGHKNGLTSNFQQHIEGAIAEACFAKYLGAYWSCSVNSFKGPDVADWQVRSTAHANGHLIIRPHDHDHYRVALLTTNTNGAVLHGWMNIADAKADQFWRPDRESWWVPQAALTPFEVFELEGA